MAGTWIARAQQCNFVTGKTLLSIENPTGSGKLVQVYRMWAQNTQLTALTGTSIVLQVRKLITLTSVSGGVLLAPRPFKSDNVALGTVSCYTNRTFTTVGSNLLLRQRPWASDEPSVGAGTIDEYETLSYGQTIFWFGRDSNVTPYVIRPNESLALIQLTTSTVGFADLFVEFTVE